jgi:hypothetical protein
MAEVKIAVPDECVELVDDFSIRWATREILTGALRSSADEIAGLCEEASEDGEPLERMRHEADRVRLLINALSELQDERRARKAGYTNGGN